MNKLKLFVIYFFLVSSCFAAVNDLSQIADKLIVSKKQRTLSLLHKGKIFKTYNIALGFTPHGHKQEEGDGKTPEGLYTIDWRQHSNSVYKSLHISYPSSQDKLKAGKANRSPGGAIMIHGLGIYKRFGKTHYKSNWTLGCVAVTDEEMDEIWTLVPNGTPIEILPF